MPATTNTKAESLPKSFPPELLLSVFLLTSLGIAFAYFSLFRTGMPEAFSHRVFQSFFAGTLASIAVHWTLPSYSRKFQTLLSPILCIWAFGPINGLLLCSAPLFWMGFLSLSPRKEFRFVLVAIVLAGLYFWRISQWNPAPAWWLVGYWLKFLCLALDWRCERDKTSWMEGLLYWYSAPFFFSPIPLEWMTFRFFRESETPNSRSILRTGNLFLLYGMALAGMEYALRTYVEPFRTFVWDLPRLDQVTGEGMHHLYSGWCFFFLRFLQYGSFTAVAVGCFHLLGRRVRYDFNFPLLSRNMWDFWARYHNYGREFLVRNLFYPVSLRLAEKINWRLAAVLGLLAVFAQISIVQFMAIVAIPGVGFHTHFSPSGVLNHTFWSFFFLGLSMVLDRGLVQIKDLAPKLSLPVEAFRVCLTQVFVAWLFYNSYFQLWSDRGNVFFLKAILSF